MVKIVHSINTSKAPKITDPTKIASIITSSHKNKIKVKVSLAQIVEEDGKIPEKNPTYEILKIDQVQEKNKTFEIVKVNQDLAFETKTGIFLECLIQTQKNVYFFTSKITRFTYEQNISFVTLNFPKTIYEIKRREYFRYYPPKDKPIKAEFTIFDITYSFNVEDISAGGLSIPMPKSQAESFVLKDIVEEIHLFFKEKTIRILTAQIVRVAMGQDDEDHLAKVSLEFSKLDSDTQDELIKNIFSEHMKHINKKKDRYINK